MRIFDKLFGRKSIKDSDESVTITSGNWSVLSGENNGNPMIIRKNHGLDKVVGNKNYSTSCGIAFKFLFPDDNGLPNIEKEPDLNAMEDDIFEMFETDLNSIFSIIISTSGFREFVFYTKNIVEFYWTLNKLKTKYRKYEFTSYDAKDEDWETYNSFN